MLFSSIPFLVCFLPIVLLIYYYCPVVKARNCFLLFASLIFYAWGGPQYVLVMLLSIAANYRTGILLGETAYSPLRRRCILAIGILINVSLLFYFKYAGFAEQVINKVLGIIHYPQFSILDIALPLGISFYTFQSISYLVDVYKKPELLQKDLLNLCLYIAFFPALIVGSIVRYHDIQEQIQNRQHSLPLFTAGIERFIIGLSKLWAFFRLGTKEGLRFLQSIFTLNPGQESAALFIKTMITPQFMLCFSAGILFTFPWWKKISAGIRPGSAPLRHCTFIALLVLVMCSLASNTYNPFIYFRF